MKEEKKIQKLILNDKNNIYYNKYNLFFISGNLLLLMVIVLINVLMEYVIQRNKNLKSISIF